LSIQFDRLFTMFFLAITNALPVVLTVLPEIFVVRKEVRNNWYSPNAYVPAKRGAAPAPSLPGLARGASLVEPLPRRYLTETPLLLLPPLIYLLIVGHACGRRRGAGLVDVSRN